MKSYSCNKYLISSFIIAACCLQQCCWAQSSTVRPYKFGFTIDEQQHRREMRDERGIVMGEFGFITADGIYHVTVYATDEQGRFRILAMKSYPYESPPKTVEVMVQPKAAPAKTTPKFLAKHNFHTEACSGCFLANGNSKPKDLSATAEKNAKHDIMTLSKTLSTGVSGGSAANPSLQNASPSAGKIFVFKPGQQAAASSAYIPTDGVAITAAITPTKSVINSHTDFNYPRNNLNNKSTLKTPTNTLASQALQHSNNAQLHNAPPKQHQYNNAHTRTAKNEANLLAYQTQSVKNIMIFKSPNSFNFLQHELSPISNLQAQKNTLQKTPLNNSPGRNSNTDSQPQRTGNSPDQLAGAKATGSSPTPQNTNKQIDAKSTQAAPITTTATSNRNTKTSAVSKDSNQRSSRPSAQGSSSAVSSSSSTTGNSPPIMEIIMEKVLPALMGKTGQTGLSGSSQSTTIDKKSNAGPSAQKPSPGDSGVKSAGDSSGSSANDNGDLYRFKYILDYHGHTETGKRNGNKEGSYFAIGEDNVERTIEYVANELGYQPRIRWRKLDSNEIKPKENTLKEYEFVWFQK